MSKQNRVPLIKNLKTPTVVEISAVLICGGICILLLFDLSIGGLMKTDSLWASTAVQGRFPTLPIWAALLAFWSWLHMRHSKQMMYTVPSPDRPACLTSSKFSLDILEKTKLLSPSRKRVLERDLRQAIDKNEFELLYQPICDLESGSKAALEALLRWNHPQLGTLMPEEFIALAEDNGSIIPLGLWALRRACSDIKDLISQGYGHLAVCVNISSIQLLDSNLPDQIAHILKERKLAPEHLVLELTESGNIRKPEIFWAIQQVYDMGVRIVLDDFGTGYSSFSNLKDLPIEGLKLDRSLVSGVNFNTKNAIILESVIRMAQALGIKVTAEGIETEEQLEMLQKFGCDLGQGYLFSRPETKPRLKAQFSCGEFIPATVR